uniref:Uncharacterized mitochondrial protein AtMg00810-like n=1 Tax=Nicotiana tabacum TaxID=4097 RepID=A0A1S3Z9Z3_TOBAC|nr:PREDICTED: uncharacterized mitochondrial protein AtMg00810-like [Nicotiana tabacum]
MNGEVNQNQKFIIWDQNEGMKIMGALKKKANIALISQIEQKNIDEALKYSSWVQAMQDELDQFDMNQVWELVPKPANAIVLGTKYVFRNKLNENGKIYVDDIIFGSTNLLLCKDLSNLMQSEFEMSMMGELIFFLGPQIHQSEDGIFICHTKYTKELIQKFGMSNAKAIGTHMSPSISLDKDEKGNSVDETTYHGMIGYLLYLTANRPDIIFSICKCARFQSAPKESHLMAVKRIIRYLIRTTSYGLWYPHSNNLKLEGFSNADLAGDKEDRKSTSETCQLL